jgi:hypothetical protein
LAQRNWAWTWGKYLAEAYRSRVDKDIVYGKEDCPSRGEYGVQLHKQNYIFILNDHGSNSRRREAHYHAILVCLSKPSLTI